MQDKNKIPDFSLVERSKVPQELTWNTEEIYLTLQEWEKDKNLLLESIGRMKEMSRDWTTSPGKVFLLLNHIDEVNKKLSRLSVYANLLVDTDMGNSIYQALRGEIDVISVNMRGIVSFIDPDILELGKEKIEQYMQAETRLNVYKLLFDSILGMKQHILPADKEEISALTGLFSESAEKAAAILNDVEIPYPNITLSTGEKMILNQPNYVRYREAESRNDRRKVMRTYWEHHSRFENTQAVLLDSEIKKHLFHTRVHHYKDCLEAALYPHKIDAEVYYTLISVVRENLAPLHRYLGLKARLLNIDKLSYDDIYASAVPAVGKTYTISDACSLIMETLKPLGAQYENILAEGFKNRWLDIYANKGKRSGAYSSGSLYDGHPYILMNFNGTFNTVSTLAHEFGHALHSYLSNKTQPYPTADYPIFLAEIASTFNEALLVHYLLKTEDDDLLKLFILDKYIEELRGTLFRQTLFADFELAMHREVEKGKTLTPEWLNANYLEITRLYYGHEKGVMAVDKYIENEWSAVPHFYYNFYVYQYSTGIAAATALADMVLNGGEVEKNRYLDFLKAGGSDYPLAILEKTGVDLTTPAPILAAINKIDELTDRMEKIVSKFPGKIKG